MSKDPNFIPDGSLALYEDVISALHVDWEPHQGQIKIGQAVFRDAITSIFVQCGRKFGKTEIILYILWRWAQSNPGSSCYYISPFQKQSKEIVWANRRVQTFGPPRWLHSINNTELRLNFENGSFIKCDGSDNFEAYRGIEPHLLIMEEYKDHRPEFMEAMRPNLSVFNAPVVYIGTPPEEDDHFYWKDAEEHKTKEGRFFYEAPTWDNPHISKAWLEEEKKRLYDRGEGDVWEREYGAKRVKGGANKVFPMLSQSIVKPHDHVMNEIYKDRKKLQFILWADPAAASCFAVLFVAINPYTKKLYFLDEIYEKDQARMTVKVIGSEIIAKRTELYSGRDAEWRQGYDEAATWFASEMLDVFDEYFEPTQKMKTDKATGLSQIKDILLDGKAVLSDRCVNLYKEMDHYRKDKSGKIPKVNDHLIDDFRYILHAVDYAVRETKEDKDRDESIEQNGRFRKIGHDFRDRDDNGFRQEDELLS